MTYSQIGQDNWIKSKGIKNGFFIDIGAGHPVAINNTLLLEQDGWSGLSFDIGPPHAHGIDSELIKIYNDYDSFTQDQKIKKYVEFWKSFRSTEIVIVDLLKININNIFELNNVPNVVDYLSFDLEPPEVTYKVMYDLNLDKYKFKYITYEHDSYRGFTNEGNEMLKYLKNKGYELEKIMNQDYFLYLK